MCIKIKDLLIKNDIFFTFDSRDSGKNSIFFALKGTKTDGHNFLEEIAKTPPLLVIVDKSYKGKDFGLNLLYVEDTLKFMQDLAKKKLQIDQKKENKWKIGITGSMGKTTTKEMLFSFLKEKYKLAKTPKSYNSQRGLPISVLNFDKNFEIAILEMGMSIKNEMKNLAKIVDPDIAIITKIGYAHIGNFNNINELIYEKFQIITKNTKIILINHFLKQKLFKYLKEKKIDISEKKIITFSTKNQEADFYLKTKFRTNSSKIKNLEIYYKNKLLEKFPALFSKTHLIENFLPSYVIAYLFNISKEKIIKAKKNISYASMRFEKLKFKNSIFIKDCYNINLDSLKSAVNNLPKVNGKKFAVIGEMRELGKYSKKLHTKAGFFLRDKIDYLLCIGEDSKYLIEAFLNKNNDKRAYFFKDLTSLKSHLFKKISKDDIVLVKGSRSLYLEKIFE